MDSTFVNQIMNKEVLAVDKSASLQETAQQMMKSNVGCVIVNDNEKPIGIVTERDFVTIAAKGNPLFTEIIEVMSTPLITIEPEEIVWQASEMMKEKRIHKLPVIEDGQIVGIITTTDIVKLASLGSDSQMRRICDQIILRMNDSDKT